MKPWHVLQDSSSDFAATATSAPSTDEMRTPTTHHGIARGVSSIGAATFALAFTEACLLLERRPIPLRFAAKYAAVNVVPSVVWRTVPVQYVAASSNLPVARLVATGAAPPTASNLSPRIANRVIAIKSLRSVRYAVASYGLIWSLMHWHETQRQDQQPKTRDSMLAYTSAGRVERVVRLAALESPLSKVTASRHGAHVVQIPWYTGPHSMVIDWSVIGLEEAKENGDGHGGGIKVLEIEIDSDHDNGAAFLIAKGTASAAGDCVRTVAVVDAVATPQWHSRTNGVEVYFFALSAIVCFLREHVERVSSQELVLTMDSRHDCDEGDNDDADNDDKGSQAQESNERSKAVVDLVRRTLVHRFGIRTHVGVNHMTRDDSDDDDHVEDQQEEEWELVRPQPLLAVFAATATAAGEQVKQILQNQITTEDRIVVVIDQSISSPPALLSRCAGVLSVADVSDAVLQQIRMQLRAGASPQTIQRFIFEEYGEQSALLHRANAASDTTKFI